MRVADLLATSVGIALITLPTPSLIELFGAPIPDSFVGEDRTRLEAFHRHMKAWRYFLLRDDLFAEAHQQLYAAMECLLKHAVKLLWPEDEVGTTHSIKRLAATVHAELRRRDASEALLASLTRLIASMKRAPDNWTAIRYGRDLSQVDPEWIQTERIAAEFLALLGFLGVAE
jgi:hypothetical protein